MRVYACVSAYVSACVCYHMCSCNVVFVSAKRLHSITRVPTSAYTTPENTNIFPLTHQRKPNPAPPPPPPTSPTTQHPPVPCDVVPSLRQDTSGGGYPLALHSKDTLVPSRTTRSPVQPVFSMSGGTAAKDWVKLGQIGSDWVRLGHRGRKTEKGLLRKSGNCGNYVGIWSCD